jgi:pyruvate kinase
LDCRPPTADCRLIDGEREKVVKRHTKIVATVGPASDSDAVLDALISAGVDIFRLNFSHGTHDTHTATFKRIRDAAARARREVAILQDLSGPKIRTGKLEGGRPLTLHTGDPLTIETGDFVGGPGRVSTTFEGLARGVKPADRLLLADGVVELRVEEVRGSQILTTVIEGDTLGEHKGISAPGVALPTSAITPKDEADLALGLSLGVDLVAVSFVQTADDLIHARRVISRLGGAAPIVAKLERPQALGALDAILAATDAVMVARGDLGLEMPLESVPRAQKDITRRARARRIPVIVATQVLESMTKEPRPTRAEVSDAANAVEDGVDGIMLSGETAVGAFPARAVRTLDVVIREAEGNPWHDVPAAFVGREGHDHTEALCEAAVTLAERGDAQAIVAVTRSGGTARRLAALRPRARIIAITDRAETARRLALHWGVEPVSADIGDNVDLASAFIAEQLVARGYVPSGGSVVLVSINSDLARSETNYLKIRRV